ncbi:Guanine nucleotide-binding protein G(k) subunit alpha [Chytriomyces hyalinus]|nr:Guanine nucleotide-binding protein G(k) subunit alpha [Chytriomyces hyalinus]
MSNGPPGLKSIFSSLHPHIRITIDRNMVCNTTLIAYINTLPGTAETGKSTILKQLKVLHGIPFAQADILHYKTQIRSNLFQCVRDLNKAMHALKIPFDFDPKSAETKRCKSCARNYAEGSVQTLVSRMSGCGNTTESSNLTQVGQDTCDKSIPIDSTSHSFNDFHICDLLHKLANSSELTLTRQVNPNNPNDPLAELAALAYLRAGGETGQTGTAAHAAQYLDLIDVSQGHNDDVAVSELTRNAVKSFWRDSGVQYCMSRGNEFHLMDCCVHLLNNTDRILHPNYIPTNQDIFYMREPTNTIQQISFNWNQSIFKVFDVGGHRKQRKSWAPYFENVKAIIFVVAISAFDQTLAAEEDGTNRVQDSLILFGTICNHPLFKKTALILFMNKIDIFKEKLKRSQISSYFPEFEGCNTYHDGCEFFVKIFLDITKYKENKVHIHFTWATDTRQISKILTSVTTFIVGKSLQDSVIM